MAGSEGQRSSGTKADPLLRSLLTCGIEPHIPGQAHRVVPGLPCEHLVPESRLHPDPEDGGPVGYRRGPGDPRRPETRAGEETGLVGGLLMALVEGGDEGGAGAGGGGGVGEEGEGDVEGVVVDAHLAVLVLYLEDEGGDGVTG